MVVIAGLPTDFPLPSARAFRFPPSTPVDDAEASQLLQHSTVGRCPGKLFGPELKIEPITHHGESIITSITPLFDICANISSLYVF